MNSRGKLLRRFGCSATMVVGLVGLMGCGAVLEMKPAEANRAAAIEKKLADARAMQALECAPKELAWAESSLALARHEAMEYEPPERMKREFDTAEANADALLAKTRPCYEARLRETTDTDGDGVVDYKDKCPNTPKGAPVDVQGCPTDSDGDGVADYLDKCAATPKGAPVDAQGCPTDADGDGVADYLDKCANTPKAATVDAQGCPTDTDGDGVADYLDKCAATPKGAPVDAQGCPTDTDGDGVADYLDKCADTPKGTAVDAQGCAADTDGDGVVDAADKCPGTPKGAPVDATGCLKDTDGDGLTDWDETQKYRTDPKRADTDGGGVSDGLEVKVAGTDPLDPADDRKEVKKLDLRVLFALNSEAIDDSYNEEIAQVAAFMKEFAQVKTVIEGHTDSQGAEAYNQDLSQRRAQAIADALVSKHGISASRLTAKGYGESRPVASNETREGRAKNRRIHAVLVSE